MFLPRILCLIFSILLAVVYSDFTDAEMEKYREKVRRMFYHAYNGYLDYAYPFDELKPIACVGHDTWGSFSLTLIDALDTLIVMGNGTEFKRAVDLVLKTVNSEANVNVSVFETNIRVVGGLLTAHMLSGRVEGMELEPGWPCSGPLLRLAEKMASRLLPAFNTDTGMPYGTVNLKYGVHKTETPVTCTAAVGTYIVEFGTLSRLTGDPQYERAALRALDGLWKSRSPIGLVGNHINVQTGVWTATDAGIGAGVDSYFEYLAKGALLLQRPFLMHQFYEFEEAINKHVRKEDWFMWVSMSKGTVSLPIFQSLEAFWPGVLTLVGNVEDASRIMLQYSQMIRQYGMPPEFFNLNQQEPVDKRAAFPLRPEMVESLMYLYRATDDPHWLELGAQMVDAIESSAKTKCGYASVNRVQDHSIEDRMESFFLAETTKYLYLLFDPENFLHNNGQSARVIDTPNGQCVIEAGGYIYNTEAHPIDPSIVHCCSANKQQDREAMEKFAKNLDMISILHTKDTFVDILENPDLTESTISEEMKDLQNVATPTEYQKRQYGSDELEFEVDPKLKAASQNAEPAVVYGYQEEDNDNTGESENRKEDSKAKVWTVSDGVPPINSDSSSIQKPEDKTEVTDKIREMIVRARLMDEEEKEKGNVNSNLAGKLIEALNGLATDYKNVPLRSTKLDEMDLFEMRERITKRQNAAREPVVDTECIECCYPLEFVGDSVALRILMNCIYKSYIYPSNRIPFVMGPVCRPWQAPKESDNYNRERPDNSNRVIAGDLPPLNHRVSFSTADLSDLAHLQYKLLTSPGLGFSYKFTGQGQVTGRVNVTV